MLKGTPGLVNTGKEGCSQERFSTNNGERENILGGIEIGSAVEPTAVEKKKKVFYYKSSCDGNSTQLICRINLSSE